MNPALNREASEARIADLRRQAGRDAIALADMRAARGRSVGLAASMIAAVLRPLQPCRSAARSLVFSRQVSTRRVPIRAAEEVTEAKVMP